MDNIFKWTTKTNGNSCATLIMIDKMGESIPLLSIKKNKTCFTSIPAPHVASFINPMDVSFEEADIYIKEKFGNIAADEVEQLRLEVAFERFKKDFLKKFNALFWS